MSKTTNVKLEEYKNIIEATNPVQIIFNNKVVWDDDAPVGDKLSDIETYNKFWESHAGYLVDKFSVSVVSFHHSVVKIKGILV